MEDVRIYTAYYGAYSLHVSQVTPAPVVPRRRQGAVCAFLCFGAASGMSTVAVAFFAHKPAVTWPVVGVGLIGVLIGILLAQRQATRLNGGSGGSRDDPRLQGGTVGPLSSSHPLPHCCPAPYTPLYCAHLMYLTPGQEAAALPGELGAAKCPVASLGGPMGHSPAPATGSVTAAMTSSSIEQQQHRYEHQHPLHQHQQQQQPQEQQRLTYPASEGTETAAAEAELVASVAAAVHSGGVVAGLPCGRRQDGSVDVVPVLVLQPHSSTQLAAGGAGVAAAAAGVGGAAETGGMGGANREDAAAVADITGPISAQVATGRPMEGSYGGSGEAVRGSHQDGAPAVGWTSPIPTPAPTLIPGPSAPIGEDPQRASGVVMTRRGLPHTAAVPPVAVPLPPSPASLAS